MALSIGLEPQTIAMALPKFTTVERRYQVLGEDKGRIVIDDYAHHPTAIKTTLETAKADYPNQPLWVAFQAHTYSRTKTLLQDFVTAFDAADQVIITDIFASARETDVTITGQELADSIAQHHPQVKFVPYDDLASFLRANLPKPATLVVMGATKINEIGLEVLDKRLRAAVVIVKDEQILLMLRRYNGEEYYTVPGGKIESGETPETAAIREAKEETSLDVTLNRLMAVIDNPFINETTHYYFVADFSGEVKLGGEEAIESNPDNYYELRWIDLKNITTIDLKPAELKAKILAEFTD
jgi:ADP-ribose pyrophosphatase YjhB (NUDIX family)